MNIELMLSAITQVVYGQLRRFAPDGEARDRGAVSLEQVLWFVAAGVAVAVVAGILWGKIKTEAEKPIQAPSAP
jgi:ABC-type nitrate/sulfonate/bicarbonate transport system permease component